ncbi:hypothetical protein GQ457_12G013880 [Hibiscus cannabinus]
MADSLLSKLGDLTFTVEEQDVVVVTPEVVGIPAEDFASSLVGMVVSPTAVDGNRLIRLFRSNSKDDKVQSISEIKPNFFLIAFASPANSVNVLKRGPWDFQKYCVFLLFLLNSVISYMDLWWDKKFIFPVRLVFTYYVPTIWMRIHNISLSFMTAALARALGASIGKVIMTDTRLEDGNMGEFMRVRVSFDTTKPLRRCVVLSRPDARASMCPLQYERLPLFCHGCGLLGHSVLVFLTTPKVEGQKFQYGAWLRAPLPKRLISRPRGRISLVEDDMDVPVPVDSTSDGPPTHVEPAKAHDPDSDPVAPAVATSVAKTPSVPITATDAENLRGPLAPSEVADLVEDAIDDASLDPENSETTLIVWLPKMLLMTPWSTLNLRYAGGSTRDFMGLHTIIRDVAASILGASASVDATVVSSRPTPTSVASPPNPGLSRSATASSCRAAMPVVLEHHEFDAWCAAQSRTPPVTTQNQPAVARNSSIPPLRPHKCQASSSDPSKAKRSRPSTSSTTRIPSVPKAGMSSFNNSSAETARLSRREK